MKSPFADPVVPRQIAPARTPARVTGRRTTRRGRMFAFGTGITALTGAALLEEEAPVVASPAAGEVADAPEETVPETVAPETTEAPPSASVEVVTTISEPERADQPDACADPATTVAGDLPTSCATDVEAPVPTTIVETASATTLAPSVDGAPESSIPPALPVVEGLTELPSIPATPIVGWPVRAIRFPVAGPVQYWDDWGNCRGGADCPRAHIGNDIIADKMQPLLAATDGVVTHIVTDHETAGWGLVITDSEGWSYNYYHVNNDTPGTDDDADDGTWRFAEGIEVGSVVTAGQIVSWVGNSGNAALSVPHLHFEIEDPAGNPINPYLSLRLADWVGRCGNLGDPLRDVLFPMAPPATATLAVPTPTGNGQFLLGPDGSWVALGDATQVGYSEHVEQDPACGASYADAIPGIRGRYDVEIVLQTIRTIESGGDYLAQSSGSSASGAYQFVDSTWRSLGGVGRAADASPAEQDMRAKMFVERILAGHGGDIATVPVVWYLGSVPEGIEWDTVPVPEAGNVFTPRQYQAKWIAEYNLLVS